MQSKKTLSQKKARRQKGETKRPHSFYLCMAFSNLLFVCLFPFRKFVFAIYYFAMPIVLLSLCMTAFHCKPIKCNKPATSFTLFYNFLIEA